MLGRQSGGDAEDSNLILVDTSVWVTFFNRPRAAQAVHLRELISAGSDLAISDLILTEILQGIREESVFEGVRRYLCDFPIFRPQGIATFVHAAHLYRRCHRMGFTVRKTIDCLIAAVAIEYGLELFHDDRDFAALARCTPLAIYRGRF